MADLAEQIKRDGLINPITLRSTDNGYELIAGHTRYLAHKHLGRTEIPATIREASDDQAVRMRLTENLCRTNLTPVEEATQLAEMVELNPNGVDGVAAAINRTPNWILDRLEILDWTPNLIEYIHTKTLSLAVARILMRIPDEALRDVRIDEAAHHGITSNTARLWLQDAKTVYLPQDDVSQITCSEAPQTVETRCEIQCYKCLAITELTETQIIRVCNNCITETQQLRAAQQPMPVQQATMMVNPDPAAQAARGGISHPMVPE